MVIGHLGSALVASAVLMLLPQASVVVQASLAVAGAGIWMVTSKSVHPPGGATALLTAIGGHKLGSGAVLMPLIAGCIALVGIRWLLDRGIALSRRVIASSTSMSSIDD